MKQLAVTGILVASLPESQKEWVNEPGLLGSGHTLAGRGSKGPQDLGPGDGMWSLPHGPRCAQEGAPWSFQKGLIRIWRGRSDFHVVLVGSTDLVGSFLRF